MDPKNLAAFDAAHNDLKARGAAALSTEGVKVAVEAFAGSLLTEPSVRAFLTAGETAGVGAAAGANPALGVVAGVVGPMLLAELEKLAAEWKADAAAKESQP